MSAVLDVVSLSPPRLHTCTLQNRSRRRRARESPCGAKQQTHVTCSSFLVSVTAYFRHCSDTSLHENCQQNHRDHFRQYACTPSHCARKSGRCRHVPNIISSHNCRHFEHSIVPSQINLPFCLNLLLPPSCNRLPSTWAYLRVHRYPHLPLGSFVCSIIRFTVVFLLCVFSTIFCLFSWRSPSRFSSPGYVPFTNSPSFVPPP